MKQDFKGKKTIQYATYENYISNIFFISYRESTFDKNEKIA